MRATIKNYVDAAKQRREENGEAGFSLIELIVVVAILGILVAIAIPVFGTIQASAQASALEASAANGATQVAADIADGGTYAVGDVLSNLSTDGTVVAVAKAVNGPGDLGKVCVAAWTASPVPASPATIPASATKSGSDCS